MVTMRMCPSCGSKNFSATPPTTTSSPQARPSNPPTYGGSSTPTSQSISAFEPAGHWRRLFAYMIDGIILSTIGAVIYGLASLLAHPNSDLGNFKLAAVVGIFLWIALPYIYFTVLHSSEKSASWGKSAMGLMVLTQNGERLKKMEAFIRCLLQSLLPMAGFLVVIFTVGSAFTLATEDMKGALFIASVIGFIVISIGPYMTIYFNPKHQTLFDLICKTCVVKK